MHPHEVAVSSSMEMIPVCPSGSQRSIHGQGVPGIMTKIVHLSGRDRIHALDLSCVAGLIFQPAKINGTDGKWMVWGP